MEKQKNLISISGRIGSGKDTVAGIIQKITGNQFEIVRFADKVKDIVCLLLNCTREQLENRAFKEKELGEEWWYWKLEGGGWYSTILLPYNESTGTENFQLIKTTPRLLMQLVGTECGRQILHPNVWVNALMSKYKPIIQSTKEEDKRLLSIWKNMNTRCKNHNYEKYHKYGGKGITICREWEDFQKFRFWALSNGYTNELTLDRINVNGNYEPSNCRFVTSSLQAFNKGSYHQGTSKLKGVNKYLDGRWQAQIQSKSIKKNLGYYQTEEEARKVYQKEYDRINKELEEESFNLQRKCVYPNFIITDTRFKNELQAIKDRGGITIRVERFTSIKDDLVYFTNDSDDAPVNGIYRILEVKKDNCTLIDDKTGYSFGAWFEEISKINEHESETALNNYEFDYFIDNNGTKEELIEQVMDILEKEKLI